MISCNSVAVKGHFGLAVVLYDSYFITSNYRSILVGEATLLHQGPEGRVVEVVDVAVGLAPAEVVADVALGRVEDDAAVEDGGALEVLVREEVSPPEHVARREVADDVGQKLKRFSGYVFVDFTNCIDQHDEP